MSNLGYKIRTGCNLPTAIKAVGHRAFDGIVAKYRVTSTSQDVLHEYCDYSAFEIKLWGKCFNSGDYRYGFNGQEKIDEISGAGNHNTALFWEYDTRLGRRWNVDPVVKFWLSPYSCFSNNTIIRIDPQGNDDYITDGTGKLIRIKKTNQEHKLFVETTIKNRKIYSEIQFNDPSEDRKLLENYEKDDQVFVIHEKADIENMVNETQVPAMSKKSYYKKVDFIMNESVEGNSLDFSGKTDTKLIDGFNIIEGKAYNLKDAGNLVWGYAASKLNFSSLEIKLGSEYYAWSEGKNSNILDKPQSYSSNPFKKWFQEKSWTGDSKEDQNAISTGVKMQRGRTGTNNSKPKSATK